MFGGFFAFSGGSLLAGFVVRSDFRRSFARRGFLAGALFKR